MKKFHATIGIVDTTKRMGMVFKPYTRALFHDYINSHEGEELVITVQKKKRSVTDNLRGYYFGAIVPFIQGLDDQWGKLSTDEIHDLLKAEFNGYKMINPFTKEVVNLSKPAMNDSCNTQDAFIYIEKIRRWVAENYGQELPDPEEYKMLRDRHFEEKPKRVGFEYPKESFEPNFGE